MWEEGGYGYPRMGRFRLEEVRDPNGIAPNWNKMGAIDHVTTHPYGQRARLRPFCETVPSVRATLRLPDPRGHQMCDGIRQDAKRRTRSRAPDAALFDPLFNSAQAIAK